VGIDDHFTNLLLSLQLSGGADQIKATAGTGDQKNGEEEGTRKAKESRRGAEKERGSTKKVTVVIILSASHLNR